MEKGEQGSAASVKAVEDGRRAVIFLFGALVVFDSVRIGAKWGDDGPQAGYFPSTWGLADLFRERGDPGARLARSGACRRVVRLARGTEENTAVLVPTGRVRRRDRVAGFLRRIHLYIAYFMWHLGKYAWIKIAPVSIGVSVAFFLISNMVLGASSQRAARGCVGAQLEHRAGGPTRGRPCS